ncbi:amino acid permease [bacterium]|nr:amino acid permease [bacterium]
MPDKKNGKIPIQAELARDLGLTSALAIGVGTMIAAGIFTLSGLAIRNVGSAAIVAFLLAAIVALFTALTYCEFVSIYPESGEGYLYARKTFSPPTAYLVGWTLFLGYTASCAFYLSSLSSYFYEFILKTPYEGLSGVVALIALTLLNIKGTKESGQFQIIVTGGKVLLLIWFIAGGIRHVDPQIFIDRFSTDFLKIGGTAAMVFITFFGFSAIAATAGEVRNPVKTIPRAIFIAMGIVTVLYTLVVLVMLAANLNEYTEAAMGTAAKKFLGGVGGLVIVGGALFSMISAANASIMAGSRVVLSMSHLRHLPEEMGTINPRTRTPIIALLFVGGTILLFKLSLHLEDLSYFANIVLLLALIMVNGALILHRRKFPDLKRPFRVPLVPLLPALGIVANLYLISQIITQVGPVLLALSCVLLGLLGFLVWKGRQTEEASIPGEPSRVAMGRYATGNSRFRVLVPLANPQNVEPLVDLAAAIAKEREGEIVTLRVALVPEQAPRMDEDEFVEKERQILEQAHSCAKKHGVPVTSLVSVGSHAARAILEAARERDCDLIILGWKGFSTTTERILGEIVDDVVNHAKRDIMLVKLVGDGPLRRLLLPTAGGEHARHAEQYAASVARYNEGSLTVCSVLNPEREEQKPEIEERLEDAVDRLKAGEPVDVGKTILRNKAVEDAIVEAAEEYDAIVIGAAGRSIYPQILFGSIPETIARRSEKPVILVKYYHPVKALFGRVMGE